MTPKLAEIAEKLEESRSALLESVDALSQEELDARPAEGAWSAGEVLHHLTFIERGITRLLSGALGRDLPPDPDPDASVVACAAHLPVEDRSIRVQAPEFVLPTHGLPREQLLDTLAKTRATLLEKAEALGRYDLRGVTHPHPRFGPLDLYQWLLVTAMHERRHTAQIREIRETLAGAGTG